METQNPGINPLRQRMIDDMRMRKFGDKTQLDYLRTVRKFAQHLGRSPDTASVEEVLNYQLHLVDAGISPASLNSIISGLKFFFNVTVDRPERVAKLLKLGSYRCLHFPSINGGAHRPTEVPPIWRWNRADCPARYLNLSHFSGMAHTAADRKYYLSSILRRVLSPRR